MCGYQGVTVISDLGPVTPTPQIPQSTFCDRARKCHNSRHCCFCDEREKSELQNNIMNNLYHDSYFMSAIVQIISSCNMKIWCNGCGPASEGGTRVVTRLMTLGVWPQRGHRPVLSLSRCHAAWHPSWHWPCLCHRYRVTSITRVTLSCQNNGSGQGCSYAFKLMMKQKWPTLNFTLSHIDFSLSYSNIFTMKGLKNNRSVLLVSVRPWCLVFSRT